MAALEKIAEEDLRDAVGNAQFAIETQGLASEAYSQYSQQAPVSPRLAAGDLQLPSSKEGALEPGGTDFFNLHGDKQSYYRQSDYYKSLKIKEIPLTTGTAASGVKQAPIDQSPSQGAAKGYAKMAAEKISSGYEQAKEKLKAWTMTETYDQTIGKYRLGEKAKKLYEQAKKQYEDLTTMDKNIAEHALEGMREGSRRAGDLGDDGSYSDQYQESLGRLGDETQEKANKMAKEALEAN